MQVDRLLIVLVVLGLLMFKVCGIIGTTFFSYSGNERFKNFILFLSYKVIFGIQNNFMAKRTNFKQFIISIEFSLPNSLIIYDNDVNFP